MLSLYRKIFSSEKGFKRNFSVLTFCNFLIHFVNLFTNMFLARAFGPEGFGQYGVLITWSSVLQVIASLGVDQVVIRAVARDHDNSLLYFKISSFARLFGFALTAIAFILYCIYTNELGLPVCALVLLNTFLLIIWSCIQSIAFGMQRMEYTGLINAVGSFILLVTYFLLPSHKVTVLIVFILLVVSQLLKNIWYYYNSKKEYIFRRNNEKVVSFVNVKDMIKESSPFFILSVFGLLTSQLPVLFLSKNAGNIEVAYFNTANKLMIPFTMIIGTLFSALYPKLVSDKKSNLKDFYETARKTLLFICFIGIISCLAISFYRNDVVLLLYGEEYRNTGMVMLTQCWHVVYFGILSLFGTLYAVMGKDKLLAALSIGNSIVWTPLIWIMSLDGAVAMSYGFVIGSIINVITNSLAIYYIDNKLFSVFQLVGINFVLLVGVIFSLLVPSEVSVENKILFTIIITTPFLFGKRFVKGLFMK